MNTAFTTPFAKAFAIVMVGVFGVSHLAASAESRGEEANTVPISTVIAAVAKRSGKKFLVDPRVQGDAVLLQGNPSTLSFEDFLMLLNVHGFAAITNGDHVRVVSDAAVRQMAVPLADGDKHPLAEYVTRVLTVKSIPASHLVPLLRPLIPQQGHLVALPCTNNLIVVDTFGNVQRLEQIIKSLDRGEPYVPEKCRAGEAARAADKGEK